MTLRFFFFSHLVPETRSSQEAPIRAGSGNNFSSLSLFFLNASASTLCFARANWTLRTAPLRRFFADSAVTPTVEPLLAVTAARVALPAQAATGLEKVHAWIPAALADILFCRRTAAESRGIENSFPGLFLTS